MKEEPIGLHFLEGSSRHISRSHDHIAHCLAQLNDADLWWSPNEECNCIGVILQHLSGNLRQWVLSGLGGQQDVRERPQEFLIETREPKDIVQRRFDELIQEVLAVFSSFPTQQLLEQTTIQGFDNSFLGAAYVAVTHLELHAGQILYITKLRLGKRYEVYWKPEDKAQGAE